MHCICTIKRNINCTHSTEGAMATPLTRSFTFNCLQKWFHCIKFFLSLRPAGNQNTKYTAIFLDKKAFIMLAWSKIHREHSSINYFTTQTDDHLERRPIVCLLWNIYYLFHIYTSWSLCSRKWSHSDKCKKCDTI